jgi:hypothetical protein
MIRFEILLPLFYNDGRPIEKEKFLQTDEELVQRFGATSTDTVVVRGRWLYQSTVYQDQLIRVRLDLEDKPDNWEAVRAVGDLDHRAPDRSGVSRSQARVIASAAPPRRATPPTAPGRRAPARCSS